MTNHIVSEFLEFIDKEHGEDSWVTLYKREVNADKSRAESLYCALVKAETTSRVMEDASWDLQPGSGAPGFSRTYGGGAETTTYHQHPHNDIRHFVRVRSFNGKRQGHVELLEEFRLFHNLYFDNDTLQYFAFDHEGCEIEVVRTSLDKVSIRMSFLRAFMAATQLNLLLYFALTVYSQENQSEDYEIQTNRLRANVYAGAAYLDEYAFFASALGKKLVQCGPVEESAVWPYTRPTNYRDFMIGGELDAPIFYSCDPAKLANGFGANPDAPHYLTPVFFKREVLGKYYSSSAYRVADGYLARGSFWGLRLDNAGVDHVSVFLGDLGRELPEKEQIYWRHFNIIPDGRQISETNFQRSFLGNFSDSSNPEHQFKFAFEAVQKAWLRKFGWSLFLPLNDSDSHNFNAIRSMLGNEQSEFDALILSLAKVTIDSVNVVDVRAYVGETDPQQKSIFLMERLFTKLGIENSDKFAAFLSTVQSLRSTGVAHRKGSKYQKAAENSDLSSVGFRAKYDEMLRDFASLFHELEKSASVA